MYLHDQGLVAGNLQPSTVWMTTAGTPQLIDRGFITPPNRPDPWSEANLHGGAPELFHQRRYDAASDRFALGVLMYMLWTGTRPYRGLTPSDQLEAMERGRPRPLKSLVSDVSCEVADLVDALLDPEPAARPSLERVARVVAGSGSYSVV